ncbi:L-carnitine dehydratase/bile acid-inducible F domain protein [Mycobacterium xenopi 3993]|nr:L-carnitine dehydratase/bile acid-inducible F domain protein [Mycobacterium xenopi 3993]
MLFERYLTFAEVAADPRVTANPMFSLLHQDGVGDYLARACRPHSTVFIRCARPHRIWAKTPSMCSPSALVWIPTTLRV